MLWVLAAVAAAGAAHAEEAKSPPPPHVAVITNPDWLRKPGPDEFSQYWPTGASSTGLVTIQCDVTAIGTLTGCVVMNEEPRDQGFGAAALKISRYFQMKPKTLDGKPVGGGIFQTRIHFTYDGIRAVDWVRHPTEDQMLAVWPEKARGVLGQVMLDCDVTAKGQPAHCRVKSETPAGMGFGAAALKLTGAIQLTQRPESGVLIPVNFIPPGPKQTGAAQFGDSLSALSNAPWLTAPVAAEMAAAWPKQAPADLQEAKVRLSCGFQPGGALGPCTVLSEEPPGLGFGVAALTLGSRFHLRSALDPAVLKKTRLILPITFENPVHSRQSPELLPQPNWVTFVDQGRMIELYPDKAADAGVKTGRGVVDCTVAAGGTLTGCTVESEDPPGMGFGEAAVAVLASFTVNPWTDDGHPVDGAKVHVPVRMNEAERDTPAPTPPPPAKPGG